MLQPCILVEMCQAHSQRWFSQLLFRSHWNIVWSPIVRPETYTSKSSVIPFVNIQFVQLRYVKNKAVSYVNRTRKKFILRQSSQPTTFFQVSYINILSPIMNGDISPRWSNIKQKKHANGLFEKDFSVFSIFFVWRWEGERVLILIKFQHFGDLVNIGPTGRCNGWMYSMWRNIFLKSADIAIEYIRNCINRAWRTGIRIRTWIRPWQDDVI